MVGGNGETGGNEDTNEEPEPPEEIIPETEDYVGYYADMEGDGTVDGIIFADMAVGNTGDGQWNDDWGKYEIPVKDNLKEYTISKEKYNDDFGENYVISPKKGTTGNERFYIMALDDFNDENGPRYCWYDAAYGKLDNTIEYTVNDFEQGKANTIAMIANWNKGANGGYGPQDDNGTYKDMWGVIQTSVGNIENPTWFVPSKSEWAAFAGELGLNDINYVNYNLSNWYWSSAQYDTNRAYTANFSRGFMYDDLVGYLHSVRLAATF